MSKKPVQSASAAGQVLLVPGVLAEVPSASDPGKAHKVRLSKNGNVYCDCEGYAFRGYCAHIALVVRATPMLKVLVRSSIRERIAHLQAELQKLDE